MRKFISSGFIVLSFVCATLVTVPAFAVDEDVVFLRKDCSGTNAGQTCFTNVDDLENWLWNTRNPTATSRVAVHIGPGDFVGPFDCPNGRGFVSLIGSGAETTKLTTGASTTLTAENCTDLHVQDLSITSTGTYAILWKHGGSSRWVNVDVSGTLNAWLDSSGNCVGQPPTHYWFNSRLKHLGAAANATYQTGCGESWFYGSELTYLVQSQAASVVQADGDAEVRAFGSVIRAVVPDGANPMGTFIFGILTSDNAQFHMHGGIISLNVSPLTNRNTDIYALSAEGNSQIHTPDTAFALKPAGTGQIYRTYLDSGATIESPFNWPPANDPPPLVSDPFSSDGADMFVETDCNASGDCITAPVAEQKPHLMVYTAKCSTAGPWFDIGRNKCRGAP